MRRRLYPRGSRSPLPAVSGVIVLRGSAHADQRTVQAAETVPRGSDQLAGGSGIGVIRDDPGGGARRGVLAEALRGGGGR
jgi:hypothetical protein